MTALALGAAVLLLAALAVSYWGAGLLLSPPFMSAMTVFPERFGAAYEKVAFLSDDGHALSGWFLASPRGRDETVVVCHGWGDNKGEILEHTLFLNRDCGYNLFYFDFRGHGESAPSPVTMGKLELVDLEAALAWAKAKRPGPLALFGISMGAAVAAQALARHPEVAAAVLESPFARYRLVGGRWAWNHYRVPYFPLVWLLMRWLRVRSGHADIDSYDPEEAVGAAKTPVFFIVGERDELMPPQDVRRVHDRAGGPKDCWVVPGAVHGKCRPAATTEYDARVGAFYRARLG
ncbi:alpha/beta fold hydrolase [bacterium]|nr:MAG: alpha/beta fold hydrolase [bacterium]